MQLKLRHHPFDVFFKRGLNVSISTDDPMIFHISNHPLLEEYSICRIFWSLSTTDLSEIARNSMFQSGFDHEWKVKWLGENYYKPCPESNDPSHSNVPMIRAHFRSEVYNMEIGFIDGTRTYENDDKQETDVLKRVKTITESSELDDTNKLLTKKFKKGS